MRCGEVGHMHSPVSPCVRQFSLASPPGRIRALYLILNPLEADDGTRFSERFRPAAPGYPTRVATWTSQTPGQ